LKKQMGRWHERLRGPVAIYAAIAVAVVLGAIFFFTREPSEEAQFEREAWQRRPPPTRFQLTTLTSVSCPTAVMPARPSAASKR
jgi:hypothetical protein